MSNSAVIWLKYANVYEGMKVLLLIKYCWASKILKKDWGEQKALDRYTSLNLKIVDVRS
jgi:hypothetical protein